MSQIIRPVVPYKGPIYDGIHEGKQIKITGCVPYGSDRFTVNLMCGLNTECDDRPLHISIRFKINTVVRNIYRHNSWDTEERSGCFPFTIGKDFTMVIVVERDAYKIFVDGKHCWSFAHRLPFTRARYIFVNGDVSVERIEFINKEMISWKSDDGKAFSRTANEMLGHHPKVVCPPSTPFDVNTGSCEACVFQIHGGIRPGMSIYITGRPTCNPYRFTINIQKGASTYPPADVALQFDVRFYNHSIVRNSRVNDVWYCEETMISYFPFHPGSNFEMVIRVQSDAYVIMVNGQDFVSFRHRLTNFSQFNVLSVQNDIIVTSIRYT